MLHGVLGINVTLRHTLGQLIMKVPLPELQGRPSHQHKGLPLDVVTFVRDDLSAWWASRNHAVHGMAKLRGRGDPTFDQRYAALEAVALAGIRVLLELDRFDRREKKRNRAGHAATWPDAFKPSADLKRRLSESNGATRAL
jgi:hypothetical protein